MTEVESPAPTPRPLPRSLRAFAHRNFRIFFGGGIVSSIGTNMQVAALAWVVQQTTGSALRTTAIAFIGVIPLLVLGPAGGVLADRVPRRGLLMATNAANGAQALALWLVWIAGYGDRYWLLFALSLAGGVFVALQTPAWQSLPAQLVPRDDLANAITLNSTQFNIARALGPLCAGILIETRGAGAAFLANAASYLAVIAALSVMRTRPVAPPPDDGLSTITRWLAGVRYVRANAGLVVAMAMHSVFAFVGPPIVYLIPKLSIDVLHIGAGSYGLLLGTFGIGAVAAAIWFGATDHRVRSSRALSIGFALASASFAGLAAARGLPAGIVAMTAFGAAYLIIVSVDHGAIQRLTDDEHRGRVTSVWLMTFGLFMPIGVLLQGWLADRLGTGVVLVADAVVMATVLVGASLSGRLRALDAR